MQKYITFTILSLAFATIMAVSAIGPALGMIARHFDYVDKFLIMQIISLQSIFIIISSLFFNYLARFFNAKTIAIIGLSLYIIGGCGAFFATNIYVILLLRAILGIGVGLIQPLSSGLIGYLYPKDEQTKLFGYMSAISNLSVITTTPISSFLGAIAWNYSFLIYLIGFFIIIPVILFLPKIKLVNEEKNNKKLAFKKMYIYSIGVFLVMTTLYTYPTNFSIFMVEKDLIDEKYIGALIGFHSCFAFATGFYFAKISAKFGRIAKFIFATIYSVGFLTQYYAPNLGLVYVAIILVGLGNGYLMPLMFSYASLASKKEDMAFVMSCMSIALYLGQFCNPYLIKFFTNIFDIQGVSASFKAGFILSLILFLWLFLIEWKNKDNAQNL